MRTWIRRTLFAVVLPSLILSFAFADENRRPTAE